MGSTGQQIRIIWIGAKVPESCPAVLPTPVESTQVSLNICFKPVERLDLALDLLAHQPWDGVVVDQDRLDEAPIHGLRQLRHMNLDMELIILVSAMTPLPLVSDWVNAVERLHVLIRPFDGAQFHELLQQWLQWRVQKDTGVDNAGGSPWLHEELARLTRQATVDQLTGLLRKEEMIRRANEELSRTLRTGEHMLCIMTDIDHFKRVNDVFGHATGDRTLQKVASLLAGGCRPYDLAGRVGGEEFMIVMPGPLLTAGQRIAERIRLSVQNYAWKEDALPNVTMSFGVAELIFGGFHDFEALAKAADMALYEAKRRGRNQVCMMEDLAALPAESAEEGDDPRPHLLLVDDAPIYLNDLRDLLAQRYRVDATTNPHEALSWAEKRAYHLVITDQNMPGLKGHQLLARMKNLQPQCVRMIMTSHLEMDTVIHAINEGEVYRYVLKPWHDDELLLIVHQALEFQSMVERLQHADRDVIRALASTLELRSPATVGHQQRVAEWSLMIGTSLQLPRERLEQLEYAAWLHDIGLVAIPDSILHATAPLSEEQERILHEHSQLGANLVATVAPLAPIAPIIRHHHEQYDGGGYPDGLSGPAIPEESRILMVVNAYDDLGTEQYGQPALAPAEALAQIQDGSGSLFDPKLVDVFTRVWHRRFGVEEPPAIG